MAEKNLIPKEPTIKNPFAPRVSTTVRRSKEEVYPHGTDLSKPQFLGSTPLDKLFQSLEKSLEGDLDEITVAVLCERLLSFQKTGELTENELRYAVVKSLLHSLIQISQLSLLANNGTKERNLIGISLHDMKTLGKIVNLIILLGIYPVTMSFGIGIAMEKRRMTALGKAKFNSKNLKPIAPLESGERWAFHLRLLELIQREFTAIFEIDSDVSSLLLKGTGYSDFLVTTIALATIPEFSYQTRAKYLKALTHVTSLPSTYELYQNYSVLLSSPSPPYFRSVVLEQLQSLPYAAVKGDGVLTLIEFILGLRESEEMSVEKIDQVSDILLLKPKTVQTVAYFSSLGTQCTDLLVKINQPIITSTVTHFMQRLWLKNSRVAQDFFFSKIQAHFSPPDVSTSPESSPSVLVSEKDLNNAVNMLLSISRLSMSSEAHFALFFPIWLDLWSYFTFLKLHKKPSSVFEDILVSALENMKSNEGHTHSLIKSIAENLMYENNKGYVYRTGPNQLVEIAKQEKSLLEKETPEKKVMTFMLSLEKNIGFFIEFLRRLDFSITQDVFLFLLSKWAAQQPENQNDNPFIRLLDLKLLEQIATSFKDDLSKTPYDSLKLLHSILEQQPRAKCESIKKETPDSYAADSDDEDGDLGCHGLGGQEDFTSVVYELLTVILQETRPGSLDIKTKNELVSIQKILEQSLQQVPTISNLVSRIDELVKEEPLIPHEKHTQRQKLDRALAEINDPLVPVRAHGLFELRQLIKEQASVVSGEFVVKTHITQLSDQDPFVYLNAIKGIESLLAIHDEKVLKAILDAYAGRDKNFSSVDDRLKLGEALLRYIQGQASALTGQPARMVVQTLLGVIRVQSSDNSATAVDDHLRMSAMSLLGMCFKTNVLGVYSEIDDALDCALGMLQLETAGDKAIMRRAALVLIHDVIAGTSATDKVPFPKEYQRKVLVVVRRVKENDPDILTREHAQSVLSYIEDLVAAITESQLDG